MAESANFEMNTFNKNYSGSILRCLEMPHAPYLNVSANKNKIVILNIKNDKDYGYKLICN
jgi:CMP-N-acetylneuraminic acid synthetase